MDSKEELIHLMNTERERDSYKRLFHRQQQVSLLIAALWSFTAILLLLSK